MFTLSINGKKLSDYGLAVKSVNRPLLPARKYDEIDLQEQDGEILDVFGYKNREISVRLYFIEKNITDIRLKIREIAYLLRKKSKLIFSDEPDKFYYGFLLEQSDLEILGTVGESELSFVCEPFAYSVEKKSKSLELGHNRNIGYQGTAQTPTRIIIKNVGNLTVRNIRIKQIKKGE